MITMVARVMAVMQDDASNCDHDCSSHPTVVSDRSVAAEKLASGQYPFGLAVYMYVVFRSFESALTLDEYHYCPLASLTSAVPHQ